MATIKPSRGTVWTVDLEPVRGHEQGRQRPAVVMSIDKLNHSSAGLVIAVPLSGTDWKSQPIHVKIEPPEGGCTKTCYALCEQVRAISTERLLAYRGALDSDTAIEIRKRIALLLAM
jgi:mRNA interferase MazF